MQSIVLGAVGDIKMNKMWELWISSSLHSNEEDKDFEERKKQQQTQIQIKVWLIQERYNMVLMKEKRITSGGIREGFKGVVATEMGLEG